MNNIYHFKLPPEFYVKVLKDYSNWKYAWVREILQNSIDAGSKNIDFKITNDEETTTIVVADDGLGMTKDVLINGFMSLGGSIKDDEDSLGGFGVASMMIAQSHISYEIISKDYICKGSRGSYTVEDSGQILNKGCVIKVVFDNSNISKWGDTVEIMKNNIITWSDYANLQNIKVFVNDEDCSPKNKKFDYIINSNIGTISFSDSNLYSNSSLIYIRMKNQPMFYVNIYTGSDSNFYGVIDLIGESKDNLTSNRDGLIADKSKFLSEIIVNLTNERSQYKFNDLNEFVLNKKSDNEYFRDNQDCLFLDKSNNLDHRDGNHKENLNMNETGSAHLSIFNKEKDKYDKIQKRMEEKLLKVNESNYPNNFKIIYNSNDSKLKNLTKIINNLNKESYKKTAYSWKFHVSSMLEVLTSMNPYDFKLVNEKYYFNGDLINFGFIFNDDVEGVCHKKGNEINILLNPNLFNFNDIDEIQDIAIHESNHILCPNHNEVSSMEELKLRRKWRKTFKISDFKKDLKKYLLNNYKK